MASSEITIVGGGIVGLALARELAVGRGLGVTVFEKETRIAAHQSSHNSGVVHAGLYYEPGSLKAELCRRGGALLREYCAERGIIVNELGKLVVARDDDELPGLERIRERAERNQVPDLAFLSRQEMAAIEPEIRGVAALHSPHTAIIDFASVARAYAADVEATGGTISVGDEVTGLSDGAAGVTVTSAKGQRTFSAVVCCGGLRSDRLANLGGGSRELHIVPFRGEYHRLSSRAAVLVHGLVYPVPDPRYPFLGVHFTPTVAGEVLAGPNAVLALAYEGYQRRDLSLGELKEILAFPGTKRLFAKHWRAGVSELSTSLSRRAYLGKLRSYLPALRLADLTPAPAGVRAQVLSSRGDLVDDFVIETSGRVTLVRNAPSPAATSSLAIAAHLREQLERAGQVPS